MITYISGGERSGKSAFAEELLKDKGGVCYIATAFYDKKDIEMLERIKKHRERRPETWRTFEGYLNLKGAIGDEDFYLLDCVTNLVSRIMYDLSFNRDLDEEIMGEIEKKSLEELESLIKSMRDRGKNLIMVSNEIGMTMVPMEKLGRFFTDILGRVNQRMAKMSDEAYFVVSGIPMRLK